MSTKKSTRKKIALKNLKLKDYAQLREAMQAAYGKGLSDVTWSEEQIRRLLEVFPEGQLCVFVDGKLAAAALAIVINYKLFGDDHSYDEITAAATFETHDPDGDVLYGIDVFVHPDFRDLRLGRRLYDARKRICERLNLRAIVVGGRIPNYAKHANKYSPQEYIRKVEGKHIHDPVLSFQIANDFRVKKVITDYLMGDHESKEYELKWTGP